MSRHRTPVKASAKPPAKPGRPGRIRVVRPNGARDSRFFAYLLFSFLQRASSLRRRQYGDDIDLAIIAEAIAIGAIDPRMRDPKFREDYGSLDKIVGVDGQRGVNALSISAATGIPRETTRRKIKHLASLGFVVEAARGKYIFRPGVMQAPALQGLIEEVGREALRFVNECHDQGLLQWTRAPNER